VSGLLRHGIRVTLQRLDATDLGATYEASVSDAEGPVAAGRIAVTIDGNSEYLSALHPEQSDDTTRFALSLARQCAGSFRSDGLWPRTVRRWRGDGGAA
jgi:hypothetical protein